MKFGGCCYNGRLGGVICGRCAVAIDPAHWENVWVQDPPRGHWDSVPVTTADGIRYEAGWIWDRLADTGSQNWFTNLIRNTGLVGDPVNGYWNWTGPAYQGWFWDQFRARAVGVRHHGGITAIL